MSATVAQPALFTAGYATWEVLSAAGLKPAFMAGHSLGEYTACAAAGAFSFEEGVRLVKARVQIVCVDHRGGFKPVRIPSLMRQQLESTPSA